ncbi:glycosyltransferase [Arthrobacter sp. BE255]|uniref:glycosyltransferase n=1 Tax=Arthrobacter sp. BE255 TaxID=2817721 RepID=UPI00285A7BC9|nr:glycosyltransferase [Arthrobacter sp. BE255]MDR7160112.1 UDP-N-acetylglucosamine transferase subunit ALG13 [Arthrobacter sp. BE255]
MKNLELLRGKRVLIVASTGGHLTQAVKWFKRLGFAPDSMFVTFDSAQSRSLLRDLPHYYVPYVAPRDYRSLLLATFKMLSRESGRDYEAIVSTGAGLALACLPISWVKRKKFYYIESVSRFQGPSLTGRIIERIPGVRRFTQHAGYASPKWRLAESLLTSYRAESKESTAPEDRPLRIFVSLGTIKPYRFDRIIDGLRPAISPMDQVVWQVGDTTRDDLPGEVFSHVDAEDFADHSSNADVVVTHAGVGTLMALLDAGKKPLVMARRAEHDEHVDDHQLQVTEKLDSLGLISSFSDTVSRDTLLELANSHIVSSDHNEQR